jgi:hypothetical protein
MSASRRIRTGQRRDGGVRVIRSDSVRYPGTVLPPEQDSAEARDSAQGSLRPARDTGLAIEGRRARESRKRAARQRNRAVTWTVAVVALVALALGWQYTSDQRAATASLSGTASAQGAASEATDEGRQGATVARAANPAPVPTPYFATYKKLKLRLPVSVENLTEVGFHQASYAYALHMDTHLPEADNGDAKKARSTLRDVASQSTAPDAKLVGQALVMWRSRPGKPDSAADVGADPGSDVFSPVSGTVVKVKKFDLYGKYPDYEIHIQPSGYPTVDCVLIHLDEVSCAPGDKVVAGVTRIAAVRKLDRRVRPQLRSYTDNGGHHTHIQLNDATHPKYKGLRDAITVPAEPEVPERATP